MHQASHQAQSYLAAMVARYELADAVDARTLRRQRVGAVAKKTQQARQARAAGEARMGRSIARRADPCVCGYCGVCDQLEWKQVPWALAVAQGWADDC